jgi:hypothetical protein
MSDEVKKKVDENWKDTVETEKTKKAQEDLEKIQKEFFKKVNLSTFLTSLGMQAMVFLGDIPNPMTNKKEKDLKQSKYMIDILNILREKTKGNLTKEEEQLFSALLYDLRVKFVDASNKPE